MCCRHSSVKLDMRKKNIDEKYEKREEKRREKGSKKERDLIDEVGNKKVRVEK